MFTSRFNMAISRLTLVTALLTTVTAGAAFAAMPGAAPTYDWSGAYAGLQAGLANGNTNWRDTPADSPNIDGLGLGETAMQTLSGGFAGAKLGYNWQFANNWVAGAEGSFSGADFLNSAADAFNPGWTLRDRTNWVGTLTARGGYAIDQALLFGRAGLAADGNSLQIENVGTNLGAKGETGLGWTAGGGVEWALGQKLSMLVEADYYDFGTQKIAFPGNANGLGANPAFVTKISQTMETVQVGVNFRF